MTQRASADRETAHTPHNPQFFDPFAVERRFD
jgi:hypothetical protein